MKHIILTGVMLLASTISGEAVAACSSNILWSRVQNLTSTLSGNTACNVDVAKYAAGEGNQEEHNGDGTLWDFKCGPPGYTTAFPTAHCAAADLDSDRRTQVGTWTVDQDGTSNATVTYHYTGGPDPEGPYAVYKMGTTYDFCDSSSTSVGQFTLESTTGSRVCPVP